MTENTIDFKDWQKLDLVVGQIIKAEDIEDADKLYKLTIDLGDKKQTVCSGLKEYYTKEELQDKKVILFANLKPRTMRGVESQGMILAACTEGEGKVHLLQPDKDIEVGSKVS